VSRVIVRLHNGVEAVVRPIRSDDKRLVADGLARLSEESAYRRFLGPKKGLTSAELRYLTEIDFRDHVAYVAVDRREPTALLGVARWVRSGADRQTAEFAFMVTDDLQGQGLGTALAEALAQAARERGVVRFVATTLPHNVAAQRLVARIAGRVTTTIEGTTYVLRGELAPRPALVGSDPWRASR
jgi:RimJ/RimL family protein N-acetyltransferase